MDNLCHTLVGAAFGEAGLKTRARWGNAILMLSANLPDVDVLAFAADMPAVALRRGWTHGTLAQVLLPVVLTGVVMLLDRLRPPAGGSRARAAPVLLLGYVGVLSHVGLDWLNTYGVRLFMPFSSRWFYGDSVFIIDPWLWLALGAGVLIARRTARRRAASLALVASCVYIAGMVVSARAARAHVRETWVREQGAEPRALMVGPTFANPFRKSVIVDAGERYHTGEFSWWPQGVRFDRRAVPRTDGAAAVAVARATPDFRAVLVWARFPYYETAAEPGGTRVILRDLRFGSRVGTVSTVVPDTLDAGRSEGDSR